MKIPEGIQRYEHLIATFWFDDDGILHSVSKPAPRTTEVMQEYVVFVKKMLNNQKVCILTDITHASPMDKETRQYISAELTNMFKAMAILSDSSIGKMIGNIFLNLNTLPFPTKMFTNEHEAKGWLKKQL
jgi:hypothetical protein